MASTLVGAVRGRWPGAHLTWATGGGAAGVVGLFEGVDRVVALPDDALLTGSTSRRVMAMAKAWRLLGVERYDLVLVGHTDRRYDVIARWVRAGERRALRDGAVRRGARRGVWMGAEYARLLEGDGGEPAQRPALARVNAAALAREVAGAGALPVHPAGHEQLVLLAPGGARNVLRDDALRRWPRSHWVSLTRQLCDAGVPVALVGGRQDLDDAAAIAHEVPAAANWVGRTTVPQLLALLQGARALVTHDSGVLHLAALAGTPTVALFGPTAPVERIPPGAPMVALSAAAGLACAPCYNGRDYAPCALNRCLRDVPPERVAQAVHQLLAHPAGVAWPS